MGSNSVKPTIENSFDFKSTYTCPVNLTYNRSAYIEIYAENPVDEDGNKLQGLNPIYTTFTLTDGTLTGSIDMPKYLRDEKLYLYSPSIGVPWLTTATASAGGVNVDMTRSTRATRAEEPVYTPLPDKLVAAIEKTLPEGKNNTKKIGSYNTSVPVTKECEIDVVFVHEHTGGKANKFLYFWYPTGNPPTSLDQIDESNSAVIFPEMTYQKLKSGETVRLKYFDGKEWTTHFPAGVTIGWMIYKPLKIETNPDAYFTSLSNLNKGGKPQTVAFRDEESQMLIFGFEDWFYANADKDFNDLLFNVKATPFDAIDDGGFPPLEEGEDAEGEEVLSGTLLFEDLYPSQGDYDMNDVVIEYTITKYFNKFNNTHRIHCDYVPKTLVGSAGLVSGFGFIIDDARIASATVNGEAYPLDATQDIILYENRKLPSYSVDIELAMPLNKDELKAPFNPFIFVGDRSEGREVHLTKMRPTDKADQTGLDEYLKNYITGTNYPFAMNVPMLNFRQVTEKVRIDQEYPDFVKWISNGKIQWWENKVN